MVEEQGVAVGLRLGDPPGAERAAGTTDILDDHALAKVGAHRLSNQARDGVTRAACGRRDQHGDRPVWIGALRRRRTGENCRRWREHA